MLITSHPNATRQQKLKFDGKMQKYNTTIYNKRGCVTRSLNRFVIKIAVTDQIC